MFITFIIFPPKFAITGRFHPSGAFHWHLKYLDNVEKVIFLWSRKKSTQCHSEERSDEEPPRHQILRYRSEWQISFFPDFYDIIIINIKYISSLQIMPDNNGIVISRKNFPLTSCKQNEKDFHYLIGTNNMDYSFIRTIKASQAIIAAAASAAGRPAALIRKFMI